MGGKRKSVVARNKVSEAFEFYSKLITSRLTDVRGEEVTFDFGSYAHILDDEDLLERINYIPETLTNPEEIRRSHHREMAFREVYVNTIYEDEADVVGESFLVVVDRRPYLAFWTCILPTVSYLKNVQRGELLWSPEN